LAASDDLQRLGLTVGRVVAAEGHPGARAPSFRLTLDLGPGGRRLATVPAGSYAGDELLGRQVVCLLLDADEALVLGAHSHAHGLVLLRPDTDVEDGTAVA
jgi:tRNA-binding protein